MYIVCVFLFQPRAPVDSRLAIRYLIGLPWVFLNFILFYFFFFLNKGDYSTLLYSLTNCQFTH